ncbi:MAG: hypothetical protein GTN80_09290 [Nitrososphaeria archaeon]|nr:hypothetical protein [Nitrososphaeria archaeon]
MTKSARYERVMAAIRMEEPDRIPWSLWGHYPALPFLKYYSWEKSNRDGEELAKAHIALLNELDYKMDLLKVTPFYRYMSQHWGSKFRFTDNNESVERIEIGVKKTEDWEKLEVLDSKRELKQNVRTVAFLSKEMGLRTPFIYTIASPLTQALNHISTPDHVYSDMRLQPSALEKGLDTIAQTCIDFGKICLEHGATGFFYGIAGGGNYWSRMNINQLEEYALKYDKKVLLALKDAEILVLHICSTEQENPQKNGGLMKNGWFTKYPVHAINWWDSSFTSISSAKKIYGKKFCTIAGIDHTGTILKGTPQDVEKEVKALIDGAAKGGFIMGPGCTLCQTTPLENFNAVGKTVEKYGW